MSRHTLTSSPDLGPGSFDLVTGDDGDNTLTGTPKDDKILGGGGDDVIYGLGGLDRLYGQSGDDKLYGGHLADVLDGGPGVNLLDGGSGADLFNGAGGDDTIIGGHGHDTATYASALAGVTVDMSNAAPQDTGGAGVDSLSGIEVLIGSPFDDALGASLFGSTVYGADGNDVIKGGPGSDKLYGGNGDDTLIPGSGNEVLVGGPGNDTARVDGAVSLAITGPQDTGHGIVTMVSIRNLIGGDDADHLTGDAGRNHITGGLGADTLTGGPGDDVFIYTSMLDSGDFNAQVLPDRITDFQHGDLIDLSRIDPDALKPGDQHFRLGGSGPGEISLSYDHSRDVTFLDFVVQETNGTDRGTIWLSGDHSDLTAADFIL